ncbi:MAG: ABC transporter permease [Anaerolineales bacterium]|nr:ABC transporter permease [Anaerolineales bacterium]
MNALDVARKDLSVFLKDRGAVLQVFLLPLIFILVFSGALSALSSGGTKADDRIALPVVDLDGGEAAQALVAALDRSGGVRVELHAQEQALDRLGHKKLARVLTIPADFTAALAANRQATLRLVNHPDARPEETEAVRLVIEGAAQDLALEQQIMASLAHMGEMMANAPDEYRVFTVERAQAQARSQFERSVSQPLVSVTQRVAGVEETQPSQDSIAGSAVPGFAVLFAFLTAQQTAHSIFSEKRTGTFRRLLASPMSKASLLMGKMLPGIVLGLTQIVVIFAFGALLGRLVGSAPMDFTSAPLALVLTIILILVCASGLGILIAAIARTENQIGGFASVILWVLGMVGGSFIPLFFLERVLGPLPRVVPHYWANRALTDILLRGLGMANVTTSLIALAAFGVLFFTIGLWRFEFD